MHQLDHVTTAGRARRRWRSLAVVAAVAVTAAACGGDDGDADTTNATNATTEATAGTAPATTAAGTASTSTSGGNTSTSAAPDGETPTAGGEATVLVFNEIGSVDPVTATGAAGADGQRMFALYGALAYDATLAETVPVLAESLTHGDDLATWTLTLRDGITFSDGTPFDAAAVQANWERAKDPANRSQAIGLANSMSTLTALDARTLEITLAAPNAHFDNGIARQALNYIASPAAFAGGTLATTPVGAGPFLLDSWLRDDRMELTANPDWKGSDGPYLDRLTFRIVGDEEQRVDTFTTGDADLFFTAVPASVERAIDEGAAGYASVEVSGGGTIVFNTAKAPFDDVRVRRAIAIGVDAAAVVDAIRPGATVATNPVVESSPWFTPGADYPAYDPDEAQRLFDEYRTETGSDVSFTLGSFQQTENVAVAEFIQTALNQYEGVQVEVDAADQPTATARVLQRDYQAHLWGFPVLDADPGLFNALHSGLPTNVTGYTNAAVDELLDEARVTTGNDERATMYQEALVQYVADMPFWHTLHPAFGYVYSDRVGGVELYEDGNLRSDLLFVRD